MFYSITNGDSPCILQHHLAFSEVLPVGPQAQHAAEGAAAAPGTHDLDTLVCTQLYYVHSYSAVPAVLSCTCSDLLSKASDFRRTGGTSVSTT